MSANKSASSLVSRTEGKTLVIERVVNAPKKLVFKCFSESEHLANWWGPQGWNTKNYTFEFKPGGMWHYCMTCTDRNQGDFFGQESCGIAVYQEIDEPNKIVCKDSFADKDGNVLEGMPSMIVTMEFVEYEGKTKIISSTEFVTEEALQQVVDMGVEQGYASQLERLDALLETLQQR
jgi:uncharacterized protein YndB with AHSA1/START domain